MTIPNPSVLPVRSPADLLALIPYLIGYTPADSLVSVALDQSQVVFAGRIDLPTAPPDDSATTDQHGAATYESDADEIAATLATFTLRQHLTSIVLVGYGPATRVNPMLKVAAGVYRDAGVPMPLALRVTDGRYFHDNCTAGCPRQGAPFDPASSPAAAHAVYAGRVALPDRAAYAAQLAPVTGAERDAMRQATIQAAHRLAHLLDHTADLHTLQEAGRAAIRDGLHRYQHNGLLSDDEAAFLTVLLIHIPIRDQAWSITNASVHHRALWSDLTRRARPDLVPAPASLLAFAAWRAGEGTLATLALDLALHADPDYRMAQLLQQIVHAGLPPSALGDWTA